MSDTKFKPNFEVLDCLRGIAAVYVVINHSRGNLLMGGSELAAVTPVSEWSLFTKLYYALLQLTAVGTEFVILFFVLSGFSIAYSLSSQQKKWVFFYKRFIRLYPPFLLGLIVAALVFILFKNFLPSLTIGTYSVFDNLKITILNLLYINEGAYISQFWSLVYEVLFYAVAPFIIVHKRATYIVAIALYIMSWVINPNYLSGTNILTKFVLDYFIYFAMGIFVFHNYKKFASKIEVNSVKMILISLAIFLSMVIIKFYMQGTSKLSLLFATLLSVFWIVNFQKHKITSRILLFLGLMSYTLYVTHFASLKLFNFILIKLNLTPDGEKITNPVFWILGVLFSILLSYVFYLIAEKPSKDLLVAIRRKKSSN